MKTPYIFTVSFVLMMTQAICVGQATIAGRNTIKK